MSAVPRDRFGSVRMFVMLCLLAAAGTALLVLPLPSILAHAAPVWAHMFGARPLHH